MIALLSLLASIALGGPALADGCVAWIGGTVHTPDAVIDGGTVVAVDGRITAVGQGANVPAGCAVTDASGKVVTAGLIEPYTRLGTVEVELEPATVDFRPFGSLKEWDGGRPVRASLVVADAYNPQTNLVAIARYHGITSAVVHPAGGLVAGQAAFVDLTGATQAEAVVADDVAVDAAVDTGGSKAYGLAALRHVLEEAAFYRDNARAIDRGQAREPAYPLADLAALRGVVDGDTPLVVEVDRAADIEAVLRLADELGLRLVLVGAAEGWRHAEALAEAGVAVLVNPYVYGAGGFDQIHGRADNAALLHAAGVPVMVGSFESHNARTLRQVAGNAVRGGLPHEAALAAITSVPAAVFGQDDRGALVPGRLANLVVWSGDPLELLTRAEGVWIGGVPQSLTTRQTELRDRYRELPGSPRPPLGLPGAE